MRTGLNSGVRAGHSASWVLRYSVKVGDVIVKKSFPVGQAFSTIWSR